MLTDTIFELQSGFIGSYIVDNYIKWHHKYETLLPLWDSFLRRFSVSLHAPVALRPSGSYMTEIARS